MFFAIGKQNEHPFEARRPQRSAVRSLVLFASLVAAVVSNQAGADATLTSVSAIGVGAEHGCALMKDGGLRCWGRNDRGQLGNGTQVDALVAVAVPGITDAVALAVGGNHTCVIVSGGAVKCWGANNVGQLGNGLGGAGEFSSVPVNVRGISGATSLASDGAHLCAIVANGAIKCWGWNQKGQLGNGGYGNNLFSSIPVDVAGLRNATALGLGGDHSCAVVGGGVQCWGSNQWGQLGYGNASPGSVYPTPGAVWGIAGATSLTAGWYHNCAIVAGGGVKCWGSNDHGQLGNGALVDSVLPVVTNGISGATALASGWYHSCAIIAGGAVQCWGWNDKGQLGDGTTTLSSLPVSVLSLTGATSLAAADLQTCVVLFGGAAKCWGENNVGQLGNGQSGANSRFTSPVSVLRTPGMDVGLLGTGFGSVHGNLGGIDCGSACSADYAVGTRVSLTATPAAGSAFTGWSGDCVGVGPCALSIISDVFRVTANFTYTGTAWSRDYVQKAYVAYYGRPADPQGQAYWAGQMDLQGGSIAAIIDAFGASDEFTQRYGRLNNTQLVTKIYQQALGRDPDPAGLAWYVGELVAGRTTLQRITLDVINGATDAPDSTVVANKLNVAAYFTAKVAAGCSYGTEQAGVSRLSGVGAGFLTVTTAKSGIDLACAINLF